MERKGDANVGGPSYRHKGALSRATAEPHLPPPTFPSEALAPPPRTTMLSPSTSMASDRAMDGGTKGPAPAALKELPCTAPGRPTDPADTALGGLRAAGSATEIGVMWRPARMDCEAGAAALEGREGAALWRADTAPLLPAAPAPGVATVRGAERPEAREATIAPLSERRLIRENATDTRAGSMTDGADACTCEDEPNDAIAPLRPCRGAAGVVGEWVEPSSRCAADTAVGT
jgi:hypothetical protein